MIFVRLHVHPHLILLPHAEPRLTVCRLLLPLPPLPLLRDLAAGHHRLRSLGLGDLKICLVVATLMANRPRARTMRTVLSS